jgi:hypothetical protein
LCSSATAPSLARAAAAEVEGVHVRAERRADDPAGDDGGAPAGRGVDLGRDDEPLGRRGDVAAGGAARERRTQRALGRGAALDERDAQVVHAQGGEAGVGGVDAPDRHAAHRGVHANAEREQ